MNGDQDCRWKFEAFESVTEGQPVQSWFNGLPEDHRDHIKETLEILKVTPRAYWDETEDFDPLIGAGGISEIRFDRIVGPEGRFYYRIYGFFDEDEGSYIFLHGTNKKQRNDKDGKRIATRRLQELEAIQEVRENWLNDFSMDS